MVNFRFIPLFWVFKQRIFLTLSIAEVPLFALCSPLAKSLVHSDWSALTHLNTYHVFLYVQDNYRRLSCFLLGEGRCISDNALRHCLYIHYFPFIQKSRISLNDKYIKPSTKI